MGARRPAGGNLRLRARVGQVGRAVRAAPTAAAGSSALARRPAILAGATTRMELAGKPNAATRWLGDGDNDLEAVIAVVF